MTSAADQAWANMNHSGASNNSRRIVPIAIKVSEVKTEPTNWLWKPYIAKETIAMLDGDPGNGKSAIVTKIACMVSRGEQLPDIEPHFTSPKQKPGNVVYVTTEDSLQKTIRPRVLAMGGDPERIINIRGGKYEDTESNTFVSLENPEFFHDLLETYEPELMVIDPISAYLGARTNVNQGNEVNAMLMPLAAMAEKFHCAIVAVRHLNKSSDGKALYRGSNSIAFMGAARTGMFVGKDPDDDRRLILAHSKTNLSAFGKSLSYKIRNTIVDDGEHSVEIGVVEFGEPSDLTADDLAGPPKPTGNEALDVAIKFLEDALSPVTLLKEDVEQRAKRRGISMATLRRAKAAIGVISQRRVIEDTPYNDRPYEWLLPSDNG